MKWIKADASVEVALRVVGYSETDSARYSPLLSALIQSSGI